MNKYIQQLIEREQDSIKSWESAIVEAEEMIDYCNRNIKELEKFGGKELKLFEIKIDIGFNFAFDWKHFEDCEIIFRKDFGRRVDMEVFMQNLRIKDGRRLYTYETIETLKMYELKHFLDIHGYDGIVKKLKG